MSQTIDDEDLSNNTIGSPSKTQDDKEEEASPLPFSKLAGDEEAVNDRKRKNISFFDRKSSLMNYGGGSQHSHRKL